MKVFVSSTCYDLLDLRAELHEDLRDLGVETLFSDLKESDFETKGDPIINSIETCLENLRGSDVVVVILSQRYGPMLKRGYGDVSATHLEYREAKKNGKRVLFYIRDRLVADWTAWKNNGRSADYKSTWAEDKDAIGLFALIDEHQKLAGGGDGLPGTNNWYWQYRTSVDLRADLRKRLEKDAYQATGEKLIAVGQVPILLVVDQLATPRVGAEVHYCFEFSLVNAGPVAAMSVQGDFLLPNGSVGAGGNPARAGAVLPGNYDKPVKISFDVSHKILLSYFSDERAGGEQRIMCHLQFGYSIPSGHMMRDHFNIDVVRRGQDIHLVRLPDYGGKTIIGRKQYLRE
jgi:hypothetical protein